MKALLVSLSLIGMLSGCISSSNPPPPQKTTGDTMPEIPANENGAMNVEELMKLIPHRYPFLMIDRVVDAIANESAVGIKNVTFNEPFFVGHFPGNPVMPGVLQIEALAQTGGLLCINSMPPGE